MYGIQGCMRQSVNEGGREVDAITPHGVNGHGIYVSRLRA